MLTFAVTTPQVLNASLAAEIAISVSMTSMSGTEAITCVVAGLNTSKVLPLLADTHSPFTNAFVLISFS